MGFSSIVGRSMGEKKLRRSPRCMPNIVGWMGRREFVRIERNFGSSERGSLGRSFKEEMRSPEA